MKNYVSQRKVESLIYNARKVAGIELNDTKIDRPLAPGYRPVEEYIKCWEKIIASTDASNIVILMAEQSHITDYGIIGQIISNSPTIGSGILNVLRFSPLVSDVVTMTVSKNDGSVYVRFQFSDCLTEQIKEVVFFKIITDFLVIANQVSNTPYDREFRYSKIETHSTPKNLNVYLDYLKSDIVTDTKRYSIEIPNKILALKTYQPAQEIIPHLLPLLEKQLNKLFSKTLASRVELFFAKTSSPVKVRIETIADELGLSTGTLKRKLNYEGTTYSKIKEGYLLKRAKFLSIELELSAISVSDNLGYNDVSAFSRAFKSWTGESFESYTKKSRKKERFH